MANPYKTFRIGTDLTVYFHFHDKETELPVSIADYTRELSFTTGRGRTYITSATLSGSGDTIIWEFDAAEQFMTGDYTVSVKLSTADGTPAMRQDFKAFRLSQYGDGVAASIDLYAYIDFGTASSTIPTISEETGNWVINGKDTGFPSKGDSVELYSTTGNNTDGAMTQKSVTAALASKLDASNFNVVMERLTSGEVEELLDLD